MRQLSPPKWADRFLAWYCNPDLLEEIQGDAHELYTRQRRQKGRRKADLIFIWNVIRFFRWSNIRRSKPLHPYRPLMMYQNYFKVFQRTLVKQKAYALLNVSGLAIGIACFLLIALYIEDEYSYDRMHTKADRIFRMHEILESDGVGERSASLPFPVAEAMLNDYPRQVEAAVRFFNFQSPALAMSTVDHQKEFNEPRVFFADSSFFKVFDFELIEGDEHTALYHTDAVVITKSIAKKYFGDENPMGKSLIFQGDINLMVTGIMEDVPPNTHFQFDFLVSFVTLKRFYPNWPGWYWNPCWTYLLLRDKQYAGQLAEEMPGFVKKYFPEEIINDVDLKFFPLTDIHLKSNHDYEIQPNGSLSTVYIFGSVAVFVILIASINFINLSTARASKRAKEVGMRKTLGSAKIQLVTQFLFESVAVCFLSVVIAVAIVLVVLPFFNAFAEKQISSWILLEPFYLYVLILLPIGVGILSGLYPAFVLSSFKPITTLKSSGAGEKGVLFRKVLVVVQFSMSIILLIGTGVSMDQLNMLQRQDTGFRRDNVIMIQALRTPVANNFEAIRTAFKQNSHVLQVTALEDILGAKHQVGNYTFEAMTQSKPIPRLNVRHDFIETFDIPLVAGRNYSEDIYTDDSLALLVNEQLVKQMGWPSNEAAIGKIFNNRPNKKIVGVVKDFNFASRHQPIKPLVIDLNLNPRAFNLFIKYMAVRVTPEDMPETIAYLESTWKQHFPGWPFDYFFLDSNLETLYKAESKLSKITIIFSGLSILVACLGLFGLSTYTVEQRKKEMSIRKVLGSSDTEIFMLFSGRFFLLIVIANLAATPLAYMLIKQWLSGFAYQVDIDFTIFIVVGIVSLAIAFFTIVFQAWRASRTNPATVLKND